MVTKAKIVWLSGAGPGVVEIAALLRQRGLDIRVAARGSEADSDRSGRFQAEDGAEETPDALVYFAPCPDQNLRVSDVPEYVAGVVGDFVTLVKSAVQPMARERRGGAVVSVCDIAGIPGRYEQVAQATASGALIAASKCLAKELGRLEINVNTLCYGVIPALGVDNYLTEAERTLFDMMQLGRSGSLEHIVENLAHLINNRHFMTGQVLHVDNGLII